jgi:PAS domain S-box-containing protein
MAKRQGPATEAEETLRAIRAGEVDAIVVSTPQGERVYTLCGADHAYRVLVEQMTEGAATLTPGGLVLFCNAQLAKLLAAPPERVTGSFLREFVAPRQRRPLEALLRRADPDGVRREFLFRSGSGALVPVYLSLKTLSLDGTPVVCAVVTDLTAQKQQQALRQAKDAAEAAARAKSEFLRHMSHEIRTPLAGVIGLAELLRQSPLTAEQRDRVQSIRLSGNLVLNIVDDILDFSAMDADHIHLAVAGLDLRSVVEETVHLMGEQAHCKGLDLACRVADGVPERVLGDEGRLRQLLVKLVGNAVKCTETGEVAVNVLPDKGGGAPARVRFEVRDTGIGVPEGARARIFEPFEPFEPAAPSSCSGQGGVGLGLALAKRLVQAMDGKIGFESRPGKGSTFWFTLPFEPVAGARSDRTPLAGRGNRRVLVIDDHRGTCDALADQLCRLGAEAECRRNAEKALRRARAEAKAGRPFDLILADVGMPSPDGFALVHRFRKDRSLRETPVVLLATFPRSSDAAAACSRAGARAYLVKPVRERDLASLLETLSVSESPRVPRELPDLPSGLTAPRPGARVLVAEDNEVNQRVAVGFLDQLRYRADVVGDGVAAVEAALRGSYDAVLMDWRMPGMDGLEAARRIRRLEQPGRHTVIIALTAHSLGGDRELCLEAGMDDYLAKPLTLENLGRTLRRWLAENPAVAPAPLQEAEPRSPESRLRKFLAAVGPEATWPIVDLFLRQTPRALGRLKKAVAAANGLLAAREAHGLRSACCQFGSPRVEELLRTVEEKATAGAPESADPLLPALEDELRRVCQILEAERPPKAQGAGRPRPHSLPTTTATHPQISQTSAEPERD